MWKPVQNAAVLLAMLLSAAVAYGAAAEGDVKEAGTGPDPDGPALRMKVPLLSERFAGLPVAIVNGEEITIGELADTVAVMHEEEMGGEKASRISYEEVLRRLINTRLFVQEARNMGLDEVPEIKNLLDTFAKTSLRQFLMREMTRDAEPDEKQVDRYYRDTVRQWQIRSLLFDREEDARAVEKRVKAGEDFASLVQEIVAAGTAKGSGEQDQVAPASLLPQVQEAVAKLSVGQISPVLKLSVGKREGFTIIRLEGEAYPDDPAARKAAQGRALADAKRQVGIRFKEELYRKHVTIMKKRLAALDYEKDLERVDRLLGDTRTIARIAGEKPITVGDLTAALKEHFYHGMDIAAEGKKLNKKKQEVLEQIIDKRLLEKEARARGIDTLPVYRKAVQDHETSMLFGALVQKAIAPDLRASEEEVRTAYHERAAEYTTPEMMRIAAIAFEEAGAAESAAKKLRKGADFRWIEENAEGQLPGSTAGLLDFGSAPLTVKGLPEDVRRAVSGARTGDYRVANDENGHYYVLQIKDMIPSRQLPFDEVEGEVKKKVMQEKLTKEAEMWADKLRAAARITIYLDPAEASMASAKSTE